MHTFNFKGTRNDNNNINERDIGQSVENRLYQSREIVNTDNPAHVLQAQANGRYVYHAIASSSQSEPTRNDQNYLSGSQLNYSEVVFDAGYSSKSNIIHGANDKTIYLEIDLVQSASYKLDSCDTSSEEDFIYIDGIVNPERKMNLNNQNGSTDMLQRTISISMVLEFTLFLSF
ncbi:unnamed protein product [Mytilus edulis]|uniref:Uncharacterized protein n=1 Tax=Mytilus edulis TaxID=6550 RepID=A0A8S3V5S1_MYTED|nr:unnamed protein product [Mytilus edulis]